MSRVTRTLDRAVPENLAWKVTDPVLSWIVGKYESTEETVIYAGNGRVEYVGDADERELGQAEVLLSLLPVILALPFLMVDVAFLPNTLSTVPVTLVLLMYTLLTTRVLGEVEIVRADGGVKA